MSKDYFSVKLISRWKFSGVCTRDCISLKLIELFLFRCKSSFGSVTHHRNFYVIRVTISSSKIFFLAMPSFSRALFKQIYRRLGAIGYFTILVKGRSQTIASVETARKVLGLSGCGTQCEGERVSRRLLLCTWSSDTELSRKYLWEVRFERHGGEQGEV